MKALSTYSYSPLSSPISHPLVVSSSGEVQAQGLVLFLSLWTPKNMFFGTVYFGVSVKLLSHVQLFATSGTVAHQGPLSMGFPRQEYWSG